MLMDGKLFHRVQGLSLESTVVLSDDENMPAELQNSFQEEMHNPRVKTPFSPVTDSPLDPKSHRAHTSAKNFLIHLKVIL